MNPDESRLRRIRTVFLKKAEATHRTGLWEDQSRYLHEVTAAVALREGEWPALLSVRTPAVWCLLTTQRLVWSADGSIHSLGYDQIQDVWWNMREWTDRRAASQDWMSIGEMADRMEVRDESERVWTVIVEPGKGPVVGICSALRAVVHDAKKLASAKRSATGSEDAAKQASETGR